MKKIIITGMPRSGKTVFWTSALYSMVNGHNSDKFRVAFEKTEMPETNLEDICRKTIVKIEEGKWDDSHDSMAGNFIIEKEGAANVNRSPVSLVEQDIDSLIQTPAAELGDTGVLVVIDSAQISGKKNMELENDLTSLKNHLEKNAVEVIGIVLTKKDLFRHVSLDDIQKRIKDNHSFFYGWLKGKRHTFFWVKSVNTEINFDGDYVPVQSNPFSSDSSADPLEPFLWMISVEAGFCPKCKSQLSFKMQYCGKCGTKLKHKA